MLAQDPETQALQPTTSAARHARDKRRPYASLHGASPHENHNCRYTFDNTDGIPPQRQGIVCCYLALMYCEHLLKNPDFHPSEFFSSVDPRQEDASRLLHLLNDLSYYSEAWHLLPCSRFSDFLRQAFTDLIGRKERPWAVYKVFTLTHSLGLRLRVKTRAEGNQELVVQVYDPNQTRVHTMARVAGPQDWGSEGQAHDFLGFLCANDDTPSARADILQTYFTALDPDAHIALYDLRADAEGQLVPHDAPCLLATNWCTSPLIQMHHAHQSWDQALLDASITRFFDDLEAKQLNDPGLLLGVPHLSRSVLHYILLGSNGVGQAQWQTRWQQTQDVSMKVRLLRGADRVGQHLLRCTPSWDPRALRWWLALVATLPAEHQLAVLKIDDELGHCAMDAWVMNGHTVTASAWPSILQTIRAHRPADVRKIMASVSTDGVPMLAYYAFDDWIDCLQEWGSLLPQVSADDLVYLLLAQDSQGISALHRAMAAQQSDWIALWGQWWATAPAASQPRLLWGMGPNGEHGLWTLARRHHAATFEAWLTLWRQLPIEQRAEVLAANGEEAPFVSVLYRAMTGAGGNPDDPEPGSAAFIAQWGACLPAVPAERRAALLQGTPTPRTSALRRGLETGHWEAVVAWASLLTWVTPNEREALTALPAPDEDPLAQSVRDHAQRDPAAFQVTLQALRDTLPPKAWAWLQAV